MEPVQPEAGLSTVKQALVALQSARKQIEAAEKQKYEPIAIIGMGCRFPGQVNTPQDFWNFLAAQMPEYRSAVKWLDTHFPQYQL